VSIHGGNDIQRIAIEKEAYEGLSLKPGGKTSDAMLGIGIGNDLGEVFCDIAMASMLGATTEEAAPGRVLLHLLQ